MVEARGVGRGRNIFNAFEEALHPVLQPTYRCCDHFNLMLLFPCAIDKSLDVVVHICDLFEGLGFAGSTWPWTAMPQFKLLSCLVWLHRPWFFHLKLLCAFIMILPLYIWEWYIWVKPKQLRSTYQHQCLPVVSSHRLRNSEFREGCFGWIWRL